MLRRPRCDDRMIIDAHAHWLSRGLREWGFSLLVHRNAAASAMPLDGIDQENARNLRCMDERRIDLQILSIRPVAMLSYENPYIDIPWCQVFNNVLAEAVSRQPDRLLGMATLPQSTMEAAVAELGRAVGDLGLVGAIVNPNPQGLEAEAVPLDDPAWFPLYAQAEALDVPLFLHGSYLRGPRYLRNRTAYLIGQTVEESIAAPTLVYGGVLDKFPKLKILLAHGGGAAPFQLGRYLTPPAREEGRTFGSEFRGAFLEGFRRLYFDGTLYTSEALSLLIRVAGPDRVLFGTETPGRGTFEVDGRRLDDLVPVVESLPLTEAERQQIFETNARTLFRL